MLSSDSVRLMLADLERRGLHGSPSWLALQRQLQHVQEEAVPIDGVSPVVARVTTLSPTVQKVLAAGRVNVTSRRLSTAGGSTTGGSTTGGSSTKPAATTEQALGIETASGGATTAEEIEAYGLSEIATALYADYTNSLELADYNRLTLDVWTGI
jgi:hypothetical protein